MSQGIHHPLLSRGSDALGKGSSQREAGAGTGEMFCLKEAWQLFLLAPSHYLQASVQINSVHTHHHHHEHPTFPQGGLMSDQKSEYKQ